MKNNENCAKIIVKIKLKEDVAMARLDIMLMFLSIVGMEDDKTADNGTKKIRCTEYTNVGKCYQTNESAVRYIAGKLKEEHKKNLDYMLMFCSDTVRKTMKYKNSKTNEIADIYVDGIAMSHYDYFKKLMVENEVVVDNDDFDKIALPISYNEKEPIPDTMKYVAEMAEIILNKTKGFRPEEVHIHADFTGGMRHAAMMLMAVIRLIQYKRMNIGFLLYSDYNNQKVEPVNDIYALLDMVSGVEEFTSFGSAKVLTGYFNRVKGADERTRSLVKNMAFFADEANLCHRGNMENAQYNLQNAMKEFATVISSSNPENLNVYERLFAIVYDTVKCSYSTLIDDKFDDLNFILWCVDHNYLQQALTLCVERLPQVMAEKGLLIISDTYRSKLEQRYYKRKRPELFEFWCFTNIEAESLLEAGNNYSKKLGENLNQINVILKDFNDENLSEIKKQIKEAISCFNKMNSDGKTPNRVKPSIIGNGFNTECKKIYDRLDKGEDREKVVSDAMLSMDNLLKKYSYMMYTNREQLQELFYAIVDIYNNAEILSDMHDKMPKIIKKLLNDLEESDRKKNEKNMAKEKTLTRNVFLEKLNKNSDVEYRKNQWKKYFMYECAGDTIFNSITKVEQNYFSNIGNCIDNDIYEFSPKITKDELENIWIRYGKIRAERNSSNHARLDTKNQFESAQLLQKFIKDLIVDIIKMCER